MTLRNKLIVGLADETVGLRVADVIQHITGSTDSLTLAPSSVAVGATTVSVGGTTSRLGFFGAAVTTRQTGVTAGNVTATQNALVNLGLISTV